MAERFKGKTVLVTGAAQGIGKACASLFAREGASLVLADLQDITGFDAVTLKTDLSDFDANRTLVEHALSATGRIDIAVLNVGGTIHAKPFVDYAEDEIRAEIDRSLWPTLWGCRAILPPMIEQGYGAIVTLGSVATRGINRVPYAAAKGGVAAITSALALEVADKGVRINCVAPGGTAVTDRTQARAVEDLPEAAQAHVKAVIAQTLRDTPMGRFGTVEEQAEAVAFLASDAASYITGQTLFVAGGGIG